MSLIVINKSPDKADISNEGAFYNLDYKNLEYGADSTLVVEITDTSGKVKSLRGVPTCGCTVSTVTQEGNVYTMTIVYDSLRKGRFHKQIQVPYKEGFSQKKIIFNIKGEIN